MKKILLFVLLSVNVCSWAQKSRGLQGTFDTDSFPQISFIWNSANPDKLTKDQFVLTEGEHNVYFTFETVTPQWIDKTPKSVLILWEDMASHRGQHQFSKTLLENFISANANTSDSYCIATFNRKKNNVPLLNRLLSDFTSDKSQLLDAVSNHNGSIEHFSPYPQNSDLYLAINEGIDLLKKEPSENSCGIIVVTAGLNIKASGASTEMETVRRNAIEAGIPIYVVKYPIFGDTPEINTLAEQTYGLTVSTQNATEAYNTLNSYFENFDTRNYGQDYRISFITDAPQDGKTHAIKLSVNKVQQQIPAFTSPDMTFWMWVKEHWIISTGIVLLVIILIVGTILIIRIGNARRNRRIAEEQAQLQAQLQGEISASNQALESFKQQKAEEESRRMAEAEKARKDKEIEELNRLMQTKNLYPRLQCSSKGQNFSYVIQKAEITIGREPDNDVVLNSSTVSRHHATISFNGRCFEIIDAQSTNKVIINGQFFTRKELANGDIIGLGEGVITFYL